MKVIYLLVFTLVLSTCKSTKKTTREMTLQNSYKVIKMLDVADLVVNPTINFDTASKKIAGFAGCNRYSADYSLKDNFIHIGIPLATKMYCTNMQIEKKFFENLGKTTHYKIKDTNLFLLDNSGALLMELEPVENK